MFSNIDVSVAICFYHCYLLLLHPCELKSAWDKHNGESYSTCPTTWDKQDGGGDVGTVCKHSGILTEVQSWQAMAMCPVMVVVVVMCVCVCMRARVRVCTELCILCIVCRDFWCCCRSWCPVQTKIKTSVMCRDCWCCCECWQPVWQRAVHLFVMCRDCWCCCECWQPVWQRAVHLFVMCRDCWHCYGSWSPVPTKSCASCCWVWTMQARQLSWNSWHLKTSVTSHQHRSVAGLLTSLRGGWFCSYVTNLVCCDGLVCRLVYSLELVSIN